MCVYKITPMHSCTYKMQPIYYIAPYTEFLIATKLNQCYGGNAKPIAHINLCAQLRRACAFSVTGNGQLVQHFSCLSHLLYPVASWDQC